MVDNIVSVEFVQKNDIKDKILPLILTVVVLIADQLTKMLVVKNILPYTIGMSFGGDFLRIIHVYNTGAAFSMGHDWAETLRLLVLSIIPLIVLIIVMIIYFRSDDFTKVQRWAIAGIVGGGLGNLIDRFFRADGVVDFIDVKFFGLFGLERWPTFNIADAAVCVCGALLICSFIKSIIEESKKEKEK